jgi:uncharacterized protein YoaH (UPF0181 family)
MTHADGQLAVVGSIAKLLTAGLGTEATVAAVAETLRAGLPAVAVTMWVREPGAAAFHSVSAPMTPDAVPLVSSLADVPESRASIWSTKACGWV